MSGAMTQDRRAEKLAMIAALPEDEIDGYEAEARLRGWFDGERAALLVRRVQLGLATSKIGRVR